MTRNDNDYVMLDDAVIALEEWRAELVAELKRRGGNERSLQLVIDAMREVHSPSDE